MKYHFKICQFEYKKEYKQMSNMQVVSAKKEQMSISNLLER